MLLLLVHGRRWRGHVSRLVWWWWCIHWGTRIMRIHRCVGWVSNRSTSWSDRLLLLLFGRVKGERGTVGEEGALLAFGSGDDGEREEKDKVPEEDEPVEPGKGLEGLIFRDVTVQGGIVGRTFANAEVVAITVTGGIRSKAGCSGECSSSYRKLV